MGKLKFQYYLGRDTVEPACLSLIPRPPARWPGNEAYVGFSNSLPEVCSLNELPKCALFAGGYKQTILLTKPFNKVVYSVSWIFHIVSV